MIYKTLSRHSAGSYGSLISYITKEGKGKDNGPVHVFTHNFRGATPKEWIHEFKVNESYRKHPRADQVLLRHSILSLSPEEDPQYATREVMEDLARKYIELRGEDGMYIVGIHEEKSHLHAHIAESGLKLYTGMAHRMTKDDMHRIKVELQQYQKDKYPQLSFSLADHGKGAEYLRDAEYFLKKRNERTLTKETIRQKVAEAYTQSKTQKEFLELLRDGHGLLHYERNGRMQGLVDAEGTRFRFSRLDVDIEALPIDVVERSEEERILEEIQAIRQEREQKYELERDDMDFSRFIHMNPNSLFE